MAMYLSLMIGSLCLAALSHEPSFTDKRRSVLLVVVLFSLFVVSGFRYQVGADYQHFVNEFNSINLRGLETSYTEYGFGLLALALGSVGFQAQSVFVIEAALVSLSMYYAIKRIVPSRYWVLAAFLFIVLGFFFASMNIMRQYYAIAFGTIGLVSSSLSARRKSLKLLLWCVAACLFHSSAVILMIVPVLERISLGKKGRLFLGVVYVASVLFIVFDARQIVAHILPYIERWSGYLDSDFFTKRNYSAALKLLVPNLLLLWYYFGKKQAFGQDIANPSTLVARMEAGALLYVVTQNAFFGITVLTRLSDYFAICYIWMCIMNISRFGLPSEKFFYTFLLVIYGFILTVGTVFIMGGSGVLPYASVLF